MSKYADLIRAQLPELANASDAEIRALARQRTGFKGSQRAFDASIGERPRESGGTRLLQALGQGTSLGWGDELAGAAAPLVQRVLGAGDVALTSILGGDLDAAYLRAKLALEGDLSVDVTNTARRELAMGREDAPNLTRAAELGGTLATAMTGGAALRGLGAGAEAAGLSGAGQAMQVLGSGATPAARMVGGALSGGVMGAGMSDQDRLGGLGRGAAVGALVPPALSAAGKVGGGLLRAASAAPSTVPSLGGAVPAMAEAVSAPASPLSHVVRAAAAYFAPPGYRLVARDLAQAAQHGLHNAAPAIRRISRGAAQVAANDGGPAAPAAAAAPSTVRQALQLVDQGAPLSAVHTLTSNEAKVVFVAQKLGQQASLDEIAAAAGISAQAVREANANLLKSGAIR